MLIFFTLGSFHKIVALLLNYARCFQLQSTQLVKLS